MRGKCMLGAVVLSFVVAAVGHAQTGEKPKPPAGHAKPQVAGAQSKAGMHGTPADEAAVRALAEHYQEAFNSTDPAKAADLYAENGVFVDENGKVLEGKSAIAQALAGGANAPNRIRLSLTVDAVRLIKPDVALMRGNSMVSGGDVPAGAGAGHWAVVAMKVAGQWKVIAAQAAANPPMAGRGR